MRSKKGLTYVELLMVMLVLGVLSVSLLPVLSQKHNIGTSNGPLDKDTTSCVLGVSTSSLSTSSALCTNVINNCLSNNNNACSTLIHLAENDPSTTNQANARVILANVCNQGGYFACKYFVDVCRDDSTKCNISGDSNDLTGYMSLPLTSTSFGRQIVENIAMQYYVGATNGSTSGMYANVYNEITNDCQSSTLSAESACDIIANNCMKNEISTSCTSILSACQTYGTTGPNSACKISYINDIIPPDPPCGSTTIPTTAGYSTRVTLCNISVNPQPNTSNQTSGCWIGASPSNSCSTYTNNNWICSTAATLCTQDAAFAACNALNNNGTYGNHGTTDYGMRNWRLPTASEMNLWGNYSVLGICDWVSGNQTLFVMPI